MEKILVQWSDRRSKGTSLVRKSAVKTGMITVGEVVVCWGKTYNAQVISLSSAQAPATSKNMPPATSKNVPEDQFCFDVADPAPSTADNMRLKDSRKRFPTILQALDSLSEKIDNFSDTLSGVEALLVCCLRMLEEKVSALQPPRENPPLPATPMPAFTMEMATFSPYFVPSQETLQTHLESLQPLMSVVD